MTRTTRASRSRRIAALVAAFLVTIVGIGSIAGPASAAPGDPVGVDFGQPNDTVYFGNFWSLEATLRNHECRSGDCESETLQVTIKGPNGVARTQGFYVSSRGIAYITSYDFGSNLPAGTYSLTAKYNSPYTGRPHPGVRSDNKPGKLIVTPAPLSIDLRVETDENQPAGAVVSSQLLGDYVDSQANCYEGPSCGRRLADGTWDFTVTGEDGEPLFEKSIATKGDAGRFASFYWHDVPASANYEASVTFTPIKAEAGNYAIDAPGTASFTSPDAVAIGGPGAPEEPVVEVVVNEDSTVPLWSIVAWLFVLAVLLALVVIFSVLIIRQRRALSRITTTEAELA